MLTKEFLTPFQTEPVDWGFRSGPNSIGELTYRRTYARPTKGGIEQWWQCDQRCVEGTFEVIQNHLKQNNLPFSEHKLRRQAEQMFSRIFDFKFTPPGRGLWMMGTDFIRERGGAALCNCAFISTKDLHLDPTKPFCFLMDLSMLGVGVGFDVKGKGQLQWRNTDDFGSHHPFYIHDSREGWVAALRQLLLWVFGLIQVEPHFDDSNVRPAGMLIKGFGGISSGPAPLMKLLEKIKSIAKSRAGQMLSTRDIVDIMNLIGVCVVAGNVRRTAEIAFADCDDLEFLDLKNYELNPDRGEYGWTSNNSVFCKVGQDYFLQTERTRINGEPGYAWLKNMQDYGRMIDPPNYLDYRVLGGNPCLEQSLESGELCDLVENYLHRHTRLDDFKQSARMSFLYAKAVMLLPIHWEESDEIMKRNFRIGTSVSGVAQFLQKYSKEKLIHWLDATYKDLCEYDKRLSAFLGVPESIKKTSVKPSGTVSLLAGATPGGHYPSDEFYIRRIRFSANHPDLYHIRAAGYYMEPAQFDPSTMVVEFPVDGPKCRKEKEVSIREKVELAVLLQKYWADNQVSYTVTFDPEKEGHLINPLLSEFDVSLKGISFLPLLRKGAYAQMPYEGITEEEYRKRSSHLKPIQWKYQSDETGVHDSEERFCDGGSCQIASSPSTR